MEEYEKRRTAQVAEESSETGPKDGEQAEASVRMIPANLLHDMLNLGRAENLEGQPRRKRPVKRTSLLVSVPMPVVKPGGLFMVQKRKFGPVDTEEFLNAAIRGKQQVVEKYLCDDGNPNVCDKLGRTALHRASIEGHLTVVQSLLEKGADVHCKDRLDSRPIHWACRGGRVEIVTVLKDHLNSRDKLHSTPLHVATRTGHAGLVEYLLSCGVKINCRDREGDTALHDAVRLNRCGIVKLLIVAGVDTQIRNHEGLTALEQVKQWHFDTMEILQRVEQLKGAGEQPSDNRETGEE